MKYAILTFIIAIFLVSCSMNSTQTATPITKPTQIASSCTDSDGAEYYTKGSISTKSGVKEDHCSDEKTLVEYQCPESETSYECPDKCQEGACIYDGSLDLNEYPYPFLKGKKFDAIIVVGSYGDESAKYALIANKIADSLEDITGSEIDLVLDSDLPRGSNGLFDLPQNNIITIGNSCFNPITAKAIGVAPGTCGAATKIRKGTGLLHLFKNNEFTVLVVEGWDAEMTELAANVIINHENYDFIGESAQVIKSDNGPILQPYTEPYTSLCGQRVYGDISLEMDLECPGSTPNVFSIQSDGVTVDCKGHYISPGLNDQNLPREGIFIGNNRKNIRIKNCVFKNANTGIRLEGESISDVIISDNVFEDYNGIGISISKNKEGVQILNNIINSNSGVRMDFSDNNRIANNKISGKFAVYAQESYNSIIEGNDIQSDLYLYRLQNRKVENPNIIEKNFWGTTDCAEIRAKMLADKADIGDSSGTGPIYSQPELDFEPFYSNSEHNNLITC